MTSPLLVVKRTINGKTNICSRTLSQKEMIHLENHQALLSEPKEILEALQKAASGKRKRTRDLGIDNETN